MYLKGPLLPLPLLSSFFPIFYSPSCSLTPCSNNAPPTSRGQGAPVRAHGGEPSLEHRLLRPVLSTLPGPHRQTQPAGKFSPLLLLSSLQKLYSSHQCFYFLFLISVSFSTGSYVLRLQGQSIFLGHSPFVSFILSCSSFSSNVLSYRSSVTHQLVLHFCICVYRLSFSDGWILYLQIKPILVHRRNLTHKYRKVIFFKT